MSCFFFGCGFAALGSLRLNFPDDMGTAIAVSVFVLLSENRNQHVLLCFIIFASRAKFCRSRRVSDRIFSRQVAKTLSDGSNAIIPTHGEVSEGEIKNILLRAFASLREIFRFFRLRLCCGGIFATFVVNVLFLFWLRLRRARFSAVGRRHFLKNPAIVRPETMRSPIYKSF
jgi:hypothetical protein